MHKDTQKQPNNQHELKTTTYHVQNALLIYPAVGRPGDADALLLAAAESSPSLAYFGQIAVRKEAQVSF
jgi:hypothetical protein